MIGAFILLNIHKEIKTQRLIDSLISRLKKDNQRLKKLDEQKTEFVSLASHQLRGPLSVMQGYVSMILDGDYGRVSKKMLEPLERIFESGAKLGFLINDYLNVSRIEKGEMEYVLEKIDLGKLIDNITKEFSVIAHKKNILLDFKCLAKGSPVIEGDTNKIRQIVSNVIDNAFKYTEKGAIRVRCAEEVDNVIISIRDTGVGISEDELDKIFHKFERGKEAMYINVSGSGLGLFVAKVMTEAMGGKIWAESEGIGHGSTFKIQFPKAK